MAVRLRWRGKEFTRFTEDKMFRGIVEATNELKRIARKNASVVNTGQPRPRSGKTYYPNSSRPGEPPRMRTGHGQRGIASGTNRARIAGRVGYTPNVRYMAMHEVGINYRRAGLQKRPTILPSVRDNRERLAAVFRRGATR